MKAMPCYNDGALSHYLAVQKEAEDDAERLNAQIATELADRATWEQGMAEAAMEWPTKRNPILDALMAEDFTEAGRLTHRYITRTFAKNQAQDSIARQDEDAANDFEA
jgi:hypothetical protein